MFWLTETVANLTYSPVLVCIIAFCVMETKLTKEVVRPHLVDSGGSGGYCGSTVERDYHS